MPTGRRSQNRWAASRSSGFVRQMIQMAENGSSSFLPKIQVNTGRKRSPTRLLVRCVSSLRRSGWRSIKRRMRLAEYFIFDAVIGNVDRHHENWGVLRKRVPGKWLGRLAPTFDHASSLGRELLDTGGKRSRKRYLEVGIDKYTEKARGAIFIAERDARAPSPLELVRWCVKQADYRQFFEKVSTRLDLLDSETVEEIIGKVPATWMTSTARDFALALVCYNRDQLREIFR